jgi:hypothetical protein
LVIAHHPTRLGCVVLTSSDTYAHVPPASLRPLPWLARSEIAFRFVPIARSRAFVPLDRPDGTARLIRDLAATSAAES